MAKSIVLLALVLCLAACTAGPGGPPSPAHNGTNTGVRQLSDGPAGVQAAWVSAENAKPGSTGWRLPARPHGQMAGFANRTYVKTGDTISFFVSTDAPEFRIEAYRIGYYGGAGGRLVWKSAELPGKIQPKCPVTPKTNMVSCDNWSVSARVPVTAAYPQGDYLFKLVGNHGQASWVPLTVWDPAGHGTYLVKNDVQTWQAWNTYGGYDYYVGTGRCPAGVYPLCSRARVVSFDRPYGDFGGAGDFAILELPLVRWLEQRHLDVDYATDVTLVDHPAFAMAHKAILSLGHDECWDYTERRAVTDAHGHGVNLAFFGASGVLRHVRLQPSPLGPNRQQVDYRDSAADPLDGHGDRMEVTGNTWSVPPASWPEEPLVGEAYNGFLDPGAPHAGLTVTNGRAWIYAGTGLRTGQTVPGVIASDVDSMEPVASYPPNVQLLAHSAANASRAQARTRRGGLFYSDMSYYTDPHGGAGVWDSGTNNWIADLLPCNGSGCPEPAVSAITANLMRLFGAGPAGRQQPSVPNAAAVYRTGR